MTEEVVNVTFEDVLSDALQRNDENLKLTAPGSEEYERLTKERDMLLKAWLELMKQKAEEPSKWRKLLDIGEKVVSIACKVVSTGFAIALPIGMFRLSNRSGFMSADEMNALKGTEKLLVK